MEVIAKPIYTSFNFSKGNTLVRIKYEDGQLEVMTRCISTSKVIQISFPSVFGFRVLDERDILEFWPTCSTPQGWIFQITDGGWFHQEKAREGFGYTVELFSESYPNEYLIASLIECVNVLSFDSPNIVECLQPHSINIVNDSI